MVRARYHFTVERAVRRRGSLEYEEKVFLSYPLETVKKVLQLLAEAGTGAQRNEVYRTLTKWSQGKWTDRRTSPSPRRAGRSAASTSHAARQAKSATADATVRELRQMMRGC